MMRQKHSNSIVIKVPVCILVRQLYLEIQSWRNWIIWWVRISQAITKQVMRSTWWNKWEKLKHSFHAKETIPIGIQTFKKISHFNSRGRKNGDSRNLVFRHPYLGLRRITRRQEISRCSKKFIKHTQELICLLNIRIKQTWRPNVTPSSLKKETSCITLLVFGIQ